MRARIHTCVCERDAFTHVCGKKAARRAGGRGREDVDIFLRATRECRERHAFDWPGGRGEGEAGGEGGERERAGKAVGVAVGRTGGEDER